MGNGEAAEATTGNDEMKFKQASVVAEGLRQACPRFIALEVGQMSWQIVRLDDLPSCPKYT